MYVSVCECSDYHLKKLFMLTWENACSQSLVFTTRATRVSSFTHGSMHIFSPLVRFKK